MPVFHKEFYSDALDMNRMQQSGAIVPQARRAKLIQSKDLAITIWQPCFVLPLRGCHCRCQQQGARRRKKVGHLFPVFQDVQRVELDERAEYHSSRLRELASWIPIIAAQPSLPLFSEEACLVRMPNVLETFIRFLSFPRTRDKFLIARNFLHAANFLRDERGVKTRGPRIILTHLSYLIKCR